MKKTAFLFLLLLVFCTKANADILDGTEVSVLGSYARTNNNSMDDNWQGSLRVEKSVYREFGLMGEFNYQYRADYRVGSLYGLGGLIGPTFRPKTSWPFQPYFYGTVGVYDWGFNEHQKFQDEGITVNLEPSVAYKCGVGIEVPIDKQIVLGVEGFWFKSEIDQSQSDGGHALGGPTIGNEQVGVSVKVGYKF